MVRKPSDPFWAPYTAEWYAAHAEGDHFDQTFRVGRAIGEKLNPKKVLDIGCGMGTMLWAVYAATRGCKCVGIEGPAVIELPGVLQHLAIPRSWLTVVDLRSFLDDPLNRTSVGSTDVLQRFDLVICVEVAEHLPKACAGPLVEYIANRLERGGAVAWSAAVPGQGGEGHINEQPKKYWLDLFRPFGIRLSESDSEAVLEEYAGHVPAVPWYENLEVLRKE